VDVVLVLGRFVVMVLLLFCHGLMGLFVCFSFGGGWLWLIFVVLGRVDEWDGR